MTNHNSISIDEAKFKKTSKKLLNHFTTEHSVNLNLSQIQEALAQSLGYRNLFDLQKVFKDSLDFKVNPNESFETIKRPDIFENIEVEQAIQIVSNLMDTSNDGTMWKSRAISLFSIVFKFLKYMQEQNEIILDTAVVREYLILDNIIKLFKTRKDFPNHIRSALRAYFVSLPGFQESAPKQNDTVMEQHGYLQMQFFSVLDLLTNIENKNFIIADKQWFVVENSSKVVSASGGTNRATVYDKENFQILTIHNSLKNLDCLEDSWLDMEEYQDWIFYLHTKNTLNKVRVSDLLVYVTTVISPVKRHKLYLVLNSILDNYSIASHISKQICAKFK